MSIISFEYPPDLVLDPPSVVAPILDGIPEYELESKFVQSYLACVAAELQLLELARQELILSWFPATADTTLVFFEQILGLEVLPALTVAQRQQAILAYYQAMKTLGEGLTWEASLSSYIGPLGTAWTYREHDPADGSSPAAYVIDISVIVTDAVLTKGLPYPGGFAPGDPFGGKYIPSSTGDLAAEQRVFVFARTITPAHIQVNVSLSV